MRWWRGLRRPSSKCRWASTYYDSQSGLHVELHKEHEISLVWKLNGQNDYRRHNVFATLELSNSTCDMYLSSGDDDNRVPFVRFDTSNGSHDDTTMREIVHQTETGRPNVSMIMTCQDDAINPIEVANRVASIIDLTKGGEYVYLSTADSKDPFDTINLCEELNYLDLEGKIMKSRLMVDCWHDEVVEEVMASGVNKFVVRSDEEIEMVTKIANDQDKTISQV
ncbi:hypothetical protein THAOC_18710 [Thalassiosira oceanica]|uniref:Uncharacterized protein n=1 Tax=Thalassiosira oceanica TaxID=159749 RepID=K0SRB8_THAOC|nr:hypothetical protein THAOC_18710 [Thalassiosira oceanica]|eukprot:EJK60877.1 hypothetical protein THAOC_18710 [Thalassiosira oceanica]